MKNFRFIQQRAFTLSHATHKKVQPSVKTKNSSSYEWLSRQLSDPFVELAKKNNYRCRSAFKLIEIDDKFRILQPGHVVIDCGAAPGSWTQVAVKRVNADLALKDSPQGTVLAIDRQPIFPITGATVLSNSDFTDPKSLENVLSILQGRKANAVISDMAPNATGIKELDKENIIQLCYAAVRFAVMISDKGASVLVKLWHGGQTKTLESDIKKFYNNVRLFKPNSSRSDSAEIFLLGKDFKGIIT
ncbi:rRNA methyltransferase 2, mitochondrial [Euwallacea fornicatus]|uniref:rRNA methyltransferase 2, mitochondrial n=1 Tax=Euwallacea fornicatus TaxID=995702 RepID=UPI00338D9288